MMLLKKIALAIAVSTGILSAGPIFVVAPGPAYSGGAGLVDMAIGWNLSSTFTNVSISTVLFDATPGGPISGTEATAYLMNLIGPTATVANEVVAPFLVTGLGSSFTSVQLFSGLTLGPGNYYLVLAPATSTSAGEQTFVSPPTVTLGSGVTDLGQTAGNPTAFDPAFTPFSPATVPPYDPISVTGNSGVAAVPEPSTGWLMICAGAILGLFRFLVAPGRSACTSVNCSTKRSPAR